MKSFLFKRSILVGIIFILIIAEVSYGLVEYKKISDLIRKSEQFKKAEKYEKAIETLNLALANWMVRKIGVKKDEVLDKIKESKKLLEDRKKYNQGLKEFSKENWQKAIEIFSKIPQDSFYYPKARIKIEEAKRKIVENQLREAETAKEKAEKIAQIEAAKRAQEEMLRRAKEIELAEKEAQEKMMNMDNDGDGLTYREELAKGTSDYDIDTDNDGIKDSEDLHPAGGGRFIPQEFEWEYEGQRWMYKLSIHEDWYEYYKRKPRKPHGLEYVTPEDPYIQQIAKTLKETAERNGYHLTSFIVSFVQSLPYVEDYFTSFDEYPKYPIETIVERNGDCEDTSYLFASLVEATGISTALIEFPGHMGVGINTVHEQAGYYYPIGEEWYYYYETTGKGWQVGQLPEQLLHKKARVIRVRDGKVVYSFPKYVKPCYLSSEFPGYYFDGENYYFDSKCKRLAKCLPYKEFYYNPQTERFYWDRNCTQMVVKGCYKSKTYPGKFYIPGVAWYYDSLCTQIYKSMSCEYPHFWDYTCTTISDYEAKKRDCDYYKSFSYFYDLAKECEEELSRCKRDIERYQAKLDEYQRCIEMREY